GARVRASACAGAGECGEGLWLHRSQFLAVGAVTASATASWYTRVILSPGLTPSTFLRSWIWKVCVLPSDVCTVISRLAVSIESTPTVALIVRVARPAGFSPGLGSGFCSTDVPTP